MIKTRFEIEFSTSDQILGEEQQTLVKILIHDEFRLPLNEYGKVLPPFGKDKTRLANIVVNTYQP